MLQARHFHWLPNAITFSRIALAFAVCLAAARHEWVLGFWLFVIALGTDFLDGLAAKKLNAITKFGTQLDRVADLLIAGGGAIGLALVGLFPWWAVVLSPIIGIFLAEEYVIVHKRGWLLRWHGLLSKMYLFSFWAYISWIYIDQAYGWHWWYVPLTFVLLAVSGMLKRHRLRAWLSAGK